MPQVTKELRTETGHRLTNYDGRCSHLHGHSYLWQVTARAHKLDDKNMVIDFKDLKKAMNAVLDPLDHCMVLAADDPLWKISAYKSHDEGGCSDISLAEVLVATNGAEPRLVCWPENPTAESFAKYALESIHAELKRLWEAGYPECQLLDTFDIANHTMPYFISSVKVWETATSYAEAQSGEG